MDKPLSATFWYSVLCRRRRIRPHNRKQGHRFTPFGSLVEPQGGVSGAEEYEIPWLHFWKASYMLTNAIYRIAAAAEKTCYLAAPDLDGRRQQLWESVRAPTSALSSKLPRAHELLGQMPSQTRSTSQRAASSTAGVAPHRACMSCTCGAVISQSLEPAHRQ